VRRSARTRSACGHKRKPHLDASEDGDGWSGDQDDNVEIEGLPSEEVNLDGRRCTGFEFSKRAAYSCCIYDKTIEIKRSHKEWMHEVWTQNGWDGVSRVVRVAFRYRREAYHAS